MLKKIETKCRESNSFAWGFTGFGILLMILIYLL